MDITDVNYQVDANAEVENLIKASVFSRVYFEKLNMEPIEADSYHEGVELQECNIL